MSLSSDSIVRRFCCVHVVYIMDIAILTSDIHTDMYIATVCCLGYLKIRTMMMIQHFSSVQ